VTVNELRQALEAHDPDPGVVLARIRARQRHRRHVTLATSVAVAVVVVLIGVVVAVAVHNPNRRSGIGGVGLTDGCAVRSLGAVFTTAEDAGASIITGQGGLTGVTATGPEGLDTFYQFRIRTFTLLAGAPLTAQIAWIPGTPAARRPPGTPTSAGIMARPTAMWSSDGSFFAVVWPTSETHNGVGPQLAIQPYQDGSVIYALGQCTDLYGIATTAYAGTFAQLPGEHSNAIARESGLRAVKLDVIASLLK